MYPITTKLLERICSYAGPVLRIVIFRKKSVQAMIEFDSMLGAQRAKAALNGVDIYRGCCTIKVEYAKPQSLNVFKNDDNTRDFSPENRHHEGKFREPDSPAAAPPYDLPYGGGGGPNNADHNLGMDKYGFQQMNDGRNFSEDHEERFNKEQLGGEAATTEGDAAQRSIRHDNRIMIYDLPQVINTDRIFNIMCLYGNVRCRI